MKESNTITQYFHTPSGEFLDSSIYITWAGHMHCDSDYSIGPRLLDTYTLVCVISGCGYLKVGSQKVRTLHQGDVFILHPQQKHYYYADTDNPWELMWISFNGKLAESLVNNAGFSRSNYILPAILTHSIRRTMLTIINALGDTADTHRLCATGQLYILFAYLNQITKSHEQRSEVLKQDSPVLRSIRFIEQNYYVDIDVDMLCEHVNYSRSYLSRTFKAETNMTIPEYINKIRIQNAISLLANSKMPVKEIAISVGIKDSFYFSKLFKKLTGETPREFRKSHDKN